MAEAGRVVTRNEMSCSTEIEPPAMKQRVDSPESSNRKTNSVEKMSCSTEIEPPAKKQRVDSPESSNRKTTIVDKMTLFVVVIVLAICNLGGTELPPENDSVEGVCQNQEECGGPIAIISSMDPDDMAIQTRQLFHTIAAVELYQAQIEIAHYLELGYLGVADHPDVAKEVRLTAHAARTQHLMTSGLMKNFKVTAEHIVKTMIPMILDAVDLQKKDIIIDSFGQIIELAKDMRQEAANTRQSYYVIQTKVQENLALVNQKNKFVVSEQERLKVEVERETKLARNAKLAQEELDEERKKMEEELATLRSHRDRWMDQTEMSGKAMGGDRTFLDATIVPTPSIFGTVVATAGNIISSFCGGNKKEKQFNKMMDALKSSQDAVERTASQKREILSRMQERRKEALERLQTVKALNLQTASLGNAESLAEASARLGDVDRQFTRIIEFWENMVTMLKFLQSDTQAGEVYLKKIENPKYAERFKSSIGRAEKSWKFFGRICGDYVQACEHDEDVSINTLYNFMSAPIDSMGNQARERRMRDIEFKIEENIQDEVVE